MSDYDDDLLDDEPEQQNGPRQLREALKRAQDQLAEMTAKGEAAERRAFFAEAGLNDLTPAQRTLLDKGYDGPNEVEKLRAFAQEAGFLAPPAAPEPDESAEAQQRIASAATGTIPTTTDTQIAELEAAAAQGQEALLAKMREHGATFTS